MKAKKDQSKKDQNNAEFKEFGVVKPEETKDTKTKDSEKTEDAKQTMELSVTQKDEQLSDINKMITDLNKIKGIRGVYRTKLNIEDQAFGENSGWLKAVNYFPEKLHLRCLIGF